ncbi:MAG: acylneuraminate cytidylyltransferase [Candidatus Marinimicrobia bacterium]|nr:acylneuraminate cytidylyltransferase [Candidatus Neomarinimicrobiota bacterium]|tara:strand:+ start:14962 stop:15699 length:738 start_codon:yes stop_codon:yes gene_type:complete
MKKNNLKILAIIGARSGSKGVVDKNIKSFLGQPLIARIIETAHKSRYINKVIVSTDSKKYANIAKDCGADVPFLRPKKLSLDYSPEIEYVSHAIKWLDKEINYQPDFIVRLLPTIPLQQANDIDSCIEKLFNDSKADSAVVISEARQHPMKSLKIIKDSDGKEKLVTYFSNSGRKVTPISRQSYDKAYFRSNVIVFKRNTLLKTKSLTGDIVRFHEIEQERSIDIDSELDFIIAEYLYTNYLKRE